MSEIQCTNCGHRFERASADFCPAQGCGFPVEFMEDAPQRDGAPPREDILRRPEEDDSDGEEEESAPPPAVEPPGQAAASDQEPMAPPPSIGPPPADESALFGDRHLRDVPEASGSGEDVVEDSPPMLPAVEGGRRVPSAVLVAGAALAALIGLGVVLFYSGGAEDVEAAGAGGTDAGAQEGDGGGNGTPDPPETGDPGRQGPGGDGPSDPQPGNGQNGNDQPSEPESVVVPDVVGLELTEAEALVGVAGLEVAVVEEETTAEAPGTVLQQDPEAGSTVDPGATVTLLAAQPPREGADLTLALAECQLILGGAPSGADALNILVHTLNEGTVPVSRAVVEVATGNVSNRGSAPITGRDSVIAPFLELQEGDYTGPTDVTLTIDPDDEIPETRRDNNTLVARVELPSARPTQNIESLPCSSR
jgi:hypothetical protein